MYLKLGNAILNYSKEEEKNSFLIFAEIVDSTISYERPVLVRTAEELELWFGKFFSSYFYLKQLLQSRDDIVLYLYKPVEVITTKLKKGENIKDEEYPRVQDLPKKGEDGIFYYVSSLGEYYIYYMESWISKNEYDSIIYYENSAANRDTLVLTTKENKFFSYFHPQFEPSSRTIIYKKVVISSNKKDEVVINRFRDTETEKIQNGSQTLAFKVASFDAILNKGYIAIPYVTSEKVDTFQLFIVGEKNTDNENSIKKKLKKFNIILADTIKYIVTREDLLLAYSSCGYLISKSTNDDLYTFTAYSLMPIYGSVVCNIDGVLITPDIAFNNTLLANLSTGNSVFMYSKTIGKTSDIYDDDAITVKIELADYLTNTYRFTIKKYGYEEIFEGPVKRTDGKERLDYIISKNSKLIYCEFLDVDLGIWEGEFTLKGAWVDKEQSPSEFIDSLDILLGNALEKDIYPDYVMIPDITRYIKTANNYSPVYNLFKIFAEELNTQFLIQNKEASECFVDISGDTYYSGVPFPTSTTDINTIYRINAYKYNSEETKSTPIVNHYIFNTPETYTQIENVDRITLAENGNDFIFNYLDDKNRLLYFYQMCYIEGIFKVPLYYLYIQGLINDTYSYSEKSFTLDLDPTEEGNPYEETDLEKKLQKYKCNYMVCNNQIYYFKKMQDGERCETSGWMRFVLGKIWRELQKDKGRLFGEKFKDKIEASIKDTLNRVSEGFSIIESLTIDQLTFDDLNNSVKLSINVGVNKVVSEDMVIDFILNYNT